MSGFEIVGVVLGALPLAISAIKGIQQLADAAERAIKFEANYKTDLADLEQEKLVFETLIEILVRPLALDETIDTDELVRQIVSDTGAGTWCKENVEKALQARLGKFHGAFLITINDMKEQCIQLLDCLGYGNLRVRERIFNNQNSNAHAPVTNRNAPSDRARQILSLEVERLRSVTNKPRREQIINRIKETNKNFERLLDISGKLSALEETSSSTSRHTLATHLLQYWRHAQRLYNLLMQAWGCRCRDSHQARLYLQHRTSATFELSLLMLFSYAPSTTHAWHEHRLRIEQVRDRDIKGAISIPVPVTPVTAISSVPTASTQRQSLARRMKTRLVHSGLHAPHKQRVEKQVRLQATQPDPPTTTTPAPSTLTSSPINKKIQDMCNIMSRCGKDAECLGALEDDVADQAYSVSVSPMSQTPPDDITLHELLRKSPQLSMTMSDALTIALIVCSSHLQLQSTAWATDLWSADDIKFPVVAGVPVMTQPYIASGFRGPVKGNGGPALPPGVGVFAGLGIMLLELCFREPIENCKPWQGLQYDPASIKESEFRLLVATLWSNEVKGQAGPLVESAIKWCLCRSPGVLDGEQWRKDLAIEVVAPIQKARQLIFDP